MDAVGKRNKEARGERRRRYRSRAVFDSAFVLLEPFFDPAVGWNGPPLQHLIFRVVRENFPELTSEEVHLMVGALQRAYRDRVQPGERRPVSVESADVPVPFA